MIKILNGGKERPINEMMMREHQPQGRDQEERG